MLNYTTFENKNVLFFTHFDYFSAQHFPRTVALNRALSSCGDIDLVWVVKMLSARAGVKVAVSVFTHVFAATTH